MHPTLMNNYPHKRGLIQEGVMDFETGWQIPILMLRWRYRICLSCEKQFDIEKEGKFYKCGECYETN